MGDSFQNQNRCSAVRVLGTTLAVNSRWCWKRPLKTVEEALCSHIPGLLLFVTLPGTSYLRRKWQPQVITTLRTHSSSGTMTLCLLLTKFCLWMQAFSAFSR